MPAGQVELPIAAAQESFLWTFPGAPVRIYLAFAVIDGIRDQIRLASKATENPQNGGLLIGRQTAGTVHIAGFEPVYPEATQDRLAAKASGRTGTTQKPGVVGFYRATAREGILLSDDDRTLSERSFRERNNVFLVLDCADVTDIKAGFFFWDGDQLHSGTTFLEFPFDSRLLPASLPRKEEPASKEVSFSTHPAAKPQPMPHIATDVPRQPSAGNGAGKKRRAALAAGFAGVALLAFAGGKVLTSRPGQQIQSNANVEEIGLAADIRSAAVLLTWDAAASVLRNARLGSVQISDAGVTREIALNRTELQAGQLTYAPASDRVHFQLDVYGESGRLLRQQVLVVLPARISAEPVTAASIPYQAPSRPTVREIPQRTGETEATSAGAVTEQALPVSDSMPSADRAAAGAGKVFQPPSNRGPLPTNQALAAPPELKTLGAVAQRLPEFSRPPVSLPPQPQTAPPPEVPPQTAEPVKPAPPRTVSSFTPPEPVRRVPPMVPRSVADMIVENVEIAIRLKLDATGRIVHAEPIPQNRPIPGFLANVAVSAAKLWKFKPALDGGREVAADYVVVFRFNKR